MLNRILSEAEKDEIDRVTVAKNAFKIASLMMKQCDAPYIIVMGLPTEGALVASMGMDNPLCNDTLRAAFPVILDDILAGGKGNITREDF